MMLDLIQGNEAGPVVGKPVVNCVGDGDYYSVIFKLIVERNNGVEIKNLN